MKKLALFICLLPLSAMLHAQSLTRPTHTTNTQPVIINGYFKALKDGTKVYLITQDKDYWKDSTVVKNGRFSFRADNCAGRSVSLLLPSEQSPGKSLYFYFYVDKGVINIEGDKDNFNDLKISGSSYAMDFYDYYNMLSTNNYFRNLDDIRSRADAIMASKDTLAQAKLSAQYDTLRSAKNKLDKQWIAGHKNSPISSYIIYWHLWLYISREELGVLLNQLSPAAKDNVEAHELEQKVYVYEHVRPGLPAMDFTQADTSGKPVSLKDFRGKYVLLNFWASWCEPCRAENPALIKLYDKYNGKGFTIISVSLDHVRNSWIKAINADKLNWTHVSDLRAWSNEVASKYAVSSIPQSILISPDGTIIANINDTDALEKQLADIFK